MNESIQVHKMSGYQVGDDRAPGNRWVTMGNALVRAGHGLALSEKRLVAIAISKLDSVRLPAPGRRVPLINITAAEYSELAGVASSAAYEALEKAADALKGETISMYEIDWLRLKNKSTKRRAEVKPAVVKMPWAITYKHCPKEGRIEMEFHPDLVPLLVGLKEQFTTYQLKQTSTLRSVYSWRLLELLSRFKTNGWAEYTIEDFNFAMDVPPGLSDFGQVNRKIIAPAIKELQEKDGWKIELELIKGGKRVKALRFKFERNPQGRFEGFDEPPALPEAIAGEGLDSAHSVEPPEPPALPPPVRAPQSEVQSTNFALSKAQWKMMFPQGFIKMNQLGWSTAAPLPDGGETPDGKKS